MKQIDNVYLPSLSVSQSDLKRGMSHPWWQHGGFWFTPEEGRKGKERKGREGRKEKNENPRGFLPLPQERDTLVVVEGGHGTVNIGYSDTGGNGQKCHRSRLSLYPVIFSTCKVLFGTNSCHCSRFSLRTESEGVLCFLIRKLTSYILLLKMSSQRNGERGQKGMFLCDMSTFGWKALKMPDTLFRIWYATEGGRDRVREPPPLPLEKEASL